MHNNRLMKDSGIEWIGEIPKGWETRKVKAFYNIQTGFTPDTKQECYYADEDGIEWLTIGDLTDSKYIPLKTKSHISQEYINKYKPKVIPSGSLLYSFKLSVGQVAFTDRPIYSNEAIASFLPNPNVCLEYLFYSSRFIIENANENIYGAKILNQDLIKNAIVPIPPFQEQQKIAGFLDEKCGHIDAILEKTKASIEDYKKLKQAIITQAVTKGIRPNRPMKNSGIEWIGEIPENWKVRKLKYVCKDRNENYSNEYGLLEYFALENIESKSAKFIHTENNYDLTQSQICKEDDVVFGKLRPYLAKIYQVPKLSCCSGEFAVFYDFDGIASYYKYLMLSHWFINIVDASTYGTKMPRANISFIKNMAIVIPSRTEQLEIVSHLDSKCAEIDKLIEKKEQLMKDLETYKKSLIYEYVTGKKEVV